MRFGKSFNILLLILVTIGVLAILFALHDFKARVDECKQRGGVLVKSSDVWSCIRAEKL